LNTDIYCQKHLSGENKVNFGSYYTKSLLVALVYEMLIKHIKFNLNEYTILDTSCGYGSFLTNDYVNDIRCRKIGADVDKIALDKAINESKIDTEFIHHNSLMQVSDIGGFARTKYRISQSENLIIIGNPPYNDTTSISKHKIKKNTDIHPKLKTRDLGISFLRSYAELDPDYVCVLHPLSYLIKKANFNLLSEFKRKYRLCDGLIISSAEFGGTSPAKIYFPILIGLYEKSPLGMSYDYINNFEFSILKDAKNSVDTKKVSFGKMDSIGNYISKYPNQKRVLKEKAVAFFYTMRDINALRRNKTFVDKINSNTVFVVDSALKYYCYVDIFKKYIPKIPYYLGNCDVFINNEKFIEIANCFVEKSLQGVTDFDDVIDSYFADLLAEF
jgi:hypothetical protein